MDFVDYRIQRKGQVIRNGMEAAGRIADPFYFGGNWTSNVDQFVFSDSTGAEYRLTDPNHTGVWTSQDSIYVSYDFNANRLYFNDGSFWIMGCTSGGSEPDLGTMYPTQMEDSNGNYIRISYYSGAGTSWPNSSGRINQVFDNLGAYAQPYQFIYDLNSGKLQQIQLSNAGVQKSITFAYVTQATSSPFANPVSMGNTMVLTGVPNAPGYTTALTSSGFAGPNGASANVTYYLYRRAATLRLYRRAMK